MSIEEFNVEDFNTDVVDSNELIGNIEIQEVFGQRSQVLVPAGVQNAKDDTGDYVAGVVLKNRYRINSVIGVGGFGVVYEAIDIAGNNRYVAVKTLKRSVSDDKKTVRRFAREIKICEQIQSEHAVKITDSGLAEDDTLFYVMEFLKGYTLEDLIGRNEELSFLDVKKIYLQVLDALSEAHSKGIVHRDLKPANIWLTEKTPGAKDFNVKVLDFGIAKSLKSNEGGKLTQTGAWMGSPAYMSPEQLRGVGITPASDIFSLGLVAIEMLTGHQAVEGSSAMDIAMKIFEDKPVELEEWFAHTSLGTIIAKCAQKAPENRYPDANALLAELQALDDLKLCTEYENARKNRTKSAPKRMVISSCTSPEHIQTMPGELPVVTEKKLSQVLLIAIVAVAVVIVCVVGYLLLKDDKQPEANNFPEPILVIQDTENSNQDDEELERIRQEAEAQKANADALQRQLAMQKAKEGVYRIYRQAFRFVRELEDNEKKAAEAAEAAEKAAQDEKTRRGHHSKKGGSTQRGSEIRPGDSAPGRIRDEASGFNLFEN